MKILLLEDDAATAAYVMRGLKEHGHVVDHATDGRNGLFLGSSGTYDVIIVDRMLPGMDGLSVVKSLRSANVKTSVIFLTTMSGIDDRVEGLNAGGDDYLIKPFAFSELLARVNALLRRPPLSHEETVLRVNDLEMDLIKRTIKRRGIDVEVQAREFKLLEFLMRHAGQVVTRTMLLENVWEFHFDPKTNIVETHISRLRSKLNQGNDNDNVIQTIRGSGYCIRATASNP